MTPVACLILAYFVLNRRPSLRIVLSIALIAIGTVVMSLGDIVFDATGFVRFTDENFVTWRFAVTITNVCNDSALFKVCIGLGIGGITVALSHVSDSPRQLITFRIDL